MSFVIDLVSHKAIAAVDFVERNPLFGVLVGVAMLVFAVLAFVKKTRRVEAALITPLAVSQLIFIGTGSYDLWRSVVRVESLIIAGLIALAVISLAGFLVFSELKAKRSAPVRKVS
jgi:hypothetical protein